MYNTGWLDLKNDYYISKAGRNTEVIKKVSR